MRTLFGYAAVAAMLATTAPGCYSGDAALADSAEEERLGAVSQALSGAYKEYYISYDESEELISSGWSQSSQVCFLTGVRGAFGKGDSGTVSVNYSGDKWRSRGGDDAAGWATCVKRDNFTSFSGAEFMFSSDSECHADVAESDTGGGAGDWNYCWWGDAFTSLRGMHGSFDSSGEYGHIKQSTTATSGSKIEVHSSSGDFFDTNYISMDGRSVFIGIPGKQRVRLMGYASDGDLVRGTIASTGTFTMSVSTYSGYNSYWLSPTTSAVCAFSKLGGDFNGGGEIAHIYSYEGWWAVDAIAGSGDVWAAVRCMAYDQTA